ncbi:hypothetical protein evm_008973 [Chilo suppressalis]|nr:hypothetical protein evm_008973 [Chilo suppressalis]
MLKNEGSSVGSRVNIQQKLQEKKQKQLAELRVIEEEIKQGKLAKTTPVAAEEIYSSLQRQPIPRAKTHADPPAWPSIEMTHSYQNYPVLPHTCNVYPTYTEIKPEYSVQNFQNDTATEINELKPRRIQNRYDNARTFYENPANVRTDVSRPLRSPNYLALETRTYEANSCGSPRNVMTNSPRNYLPDVSNTYESTPLDKPRLQTAVYAENHTIAEYLGYCENQYSKFEANDVTALHSPLNVQGIDNMRSYECGQYGQNCERMYGGYPGLGKKERDRKMQRCRTPEILLAPHYLEGCSRQVCCHWGPPYTNRKKEEGAAGSSGDDSPDTPRPPSDIDSQISLPRSYTLPREFRYWRRRPRLRDTHVPSNNSSDGDVDSADNESDRRSNCSASPQLQRRRPPRYHPPKPETKL